MKVVKKTNLNTVDDVNALFEEVGILQQIHHPNVMRLHAFYEGLDSFALVTELVVGGELFDRIISLEQYKWGRLPF